MPSTIDRRAIDRHAIDRRAFLRAAGAGAAALETAGALASCGSGNSGNSGNTEQGSGGTTTLTWWDYFTLENFQPGMRALIKDIEANVPDVRIDCDTRVRQSVTALSLGASWGRGSCLRCGGRSGRGATQSPRQVH